MQRWRVYLAQFMPDIRVVKAPELRPYVGLLTFSAASLAIAIGMTLQKYTVFEYHSSSGVVGWLSVNAYPKQQEYFYYLLALLGIPITIGLYWFGWWTYSRWCAKRTGQPIVRVLKANALASIPLWLCWLQVYPIGQNILIGFVLPIVLSVLLKLGLLYRQYFPGLWASTDAAENLDSEEREETTPDGYSTPKFWRVALEYIVLPIFIYLLTYSGNIHGNIDLFHEGERLAPLNEMLRGGVPFRDIYVQHGVFQNAYLAWVGGQIFEPTLFGLRTMERVLNPLGYVALYLLGLQVFRGRFLTAFLCVLIASGTEFSVSARHSLGLISFAFVANFLTPLQLKLKINVLSWKLLFSGIFTSLAFWYSTEIGLYALGAIGLFLLIYSFSRGEVTSSVRQSENEHARKKGVKKRLFPVISYSCGVLLGFLPVGLYFLSHGALDDAIWNSYIQCRYQLATWGLAFPSLSETLTLLSSEGGSAFIFSKGFRWYLPICIFLIVAGYLTYRGLSRTHSANTLKLLLLLLGGVAFFRTALGRSDGGHLNFGATFLWLLCLLPLEGGILSMLRAGLSSFRGKTPWHVALKATWVLIPTVIFCWYVGEVHNPLSDFNGKWQRLRQNPFKQRVVSEELARAGAVDIPDDQVQQIQTVVAYIQENTKPNEKIFDFTSQGAYYFFADRPSVTRFHQVSYASTPSMQEEVIAALERDKTRLVIFKTGGWFDAVDGIRVEERHALIAAYLQENYEPAININGTEILMRK